MYYLKLAVTFLIKYDIFILSALFAVTLVFGIVNWCKNPYRKQNKQLNACRRRILITPRHTGMIMASAPAEYRRQWRAYVSSGAKKPSLVFEFVPHKNRVVLWRLFTVCAVASTLYLVIFCLAPAHREYLFFQIAFWLFFALSLVINKVVFVRHEKYARSTFGKFVAQLNASQQNAGSDNGVDDLVKQLHDMKKDGVTAPALANASQLLRQKGLDGTRTVSEQRQINVALNGLLQAYARNAIRAH